MTRVVNSRIRFLLLLIIVAFGALLARAAWIQTVRAASLSRLATAQTRIPVILPAGRGTIFDAMGTPLALGEQATTIFADPRQITHPAADAAIAARVLHLKAPAWIADREAPPQSSVHQPDSCPAASQTRRCRCGLRF